MEVDDFELADLRLTPGEIEFENCKILSRKLRLSESQASDERLWAGLCNKTFYSYIRERSQLARKHLKKTGDDSGAILSRFFYKSSGRSGMFRNALARCWWTGKLTYSEKYDNHWELLDAIGSSDILSKISDILYSNSYTSNSNVVEGICEALKFFKDRGYNLTVRDHIRPLTKYLNAVGGGLLLDSFTADEIKTMSVERIGMLLKGDGLDFLEEDNTEDNLTDEESFDIPDADAEVNVAFDDYEDAKDEQENASIDEDVVLGKLVKVEYGCKIHISVNQGERFYVHQMPLADMPLNLMETYFMGKEIGAVWTMGKDTYELVDISRH